MKAYYSKTGYVKNIIENVIYQTHIIYLGIHDSLDNYVDVTEKEYNDYLKLQEEELGL
jgi:hypothetical protein